MTALAFRFMGGRLAPVLPSRLFPLLDASVRPMALVRPPAGVLVGPAPAERRPAPYRIRKDRVTGRWLAERRRADGVYVLLEERLSHWGALQLVKIDAFYRSAGAR